MISDSVISAICVTLFIGLFFPIMSYILYGLRNRGKGVWTAWLLGAAGFFVTQILVRSPILSLLAMNEGFSEFAEKYYVIYCFVMAFTAGLFEAAGRYAVAKILGQKLTFERGIAAGMGHGGIEAISIIGVNYIVNLMYAQMINTGVYDAMIEETAAAGVDTSSLVMMRDTLLQTSATEFYLAGYERILTMILHVALSLLVCRFVWQKKDAMGVLISMGVHCAVDFVTMLVNGLATSYLGSVISQRTAYVLVYTFLTIVAAASLVYIFYVRHLWKIRPGEDETESTGTKKAKTKKAKAQKAKTGNTGA